MCALLNRLLFSTDYNISTGYNWFQAALGQVVLAGLALMLILASSSGSHTLGRFSPRTDGCTRYVPITALTCKYALRHVQHVDSQPLLTFHQHANALWKNNASTLARDGQASIGPSGVLQHTRGTVWKALHLLGSGESSPPSRYFSPWACWRYDLVDIQAVTISFETWICLARTTLMLSV